MRRISTILFSENRKAQASLTFGAIKPILEKTLGFDFNNNAQFTALMELSPTVVLILNNQHSKYEYCSKNIKSLLGYTSEEILDQGLGLGPSLVSKEQIPVFDQELIPFLLKTMNSHKELGDLKNIRFSYNFKARKKDGSAIWILQHITIIETDDNGNALLSLVFMTDITSIKKDDSIDFCVLKEGEEGYFKPILTNTFPVKKENIVFTQRELDILTLINNGYSTIQIADKLCLSEHTVSTHRKNIRKKLRVTKNSELINSLKMKGLIE